MTLNDLIRVLIFDSHAVHQCRLAEVHRSDIAELSLIA